MSTPGLLRTPHELELLSEGQKLPGDPSKQFTYDMCFFFAGKPDSAGYIGRIAIERRVSVRSIVAAYGTAPTGQAVLTIDVTEPGGRPTVIASITFEADGTITYNYPPHQLLVPGTVLSVNQPASADGTLADIAVTFVGELV